MILDQNNIPFPGNEHECGCGCGHDHSHDEHDGEFTPTVTLVDDNGNEVEFIFVDMAEHEGATYAALIPAEESDDNDDMIIMRIDTDEDGNEFLSAIEDDDEFNAVAAEFVELLSDEFDFDINGDQQ